MINPLERLRQRQARRRFMPKARKSGPGTTAKIAGVLMLGIVAVAALLEMRRGGGAEAAVAAYAREERMEPLELIEVAGRSRRLIFLADVAGAAAPKRFASRAIERLATTSGLDLVVLDVDSEEQPYIDRYLATAPEDASILLGRPRLVKEAEGMGREYLEVYRTVWRVNSELGAARRVRIVAADYPGWPPARPASPSEAAQMYGQRDAHMLETVAERSLDRNPNARVFFFVDGVHALRGGARIQTGGTRPVETTSLAALLSERFPQDVYTILVDAQPARVLTPPLASYMGTSAADLLRRASVGSGFALRTGNALDELPRPVIRTESRTGVDFTVLPREARMSELADAYIFF